MNSHIETPMQALVKKTLLFLVTVALGSYAAAQSLGDLGRTERSKRAAAGNEAPKVKVLTDDDPPQPATNGPHQATDSPPLPWQRSRSQPEKKDSSTFTRQPSTAEIRQECRNIAADEATESSNDFCYIMSASMDSWYETLVDRAVALRNELCSNRVDLGSEPADPALAAKYHE